MRYREKINQLVTSVYTDSRDHSNDVHDYSNEIEYTSMQAYMAMLDVVTPDWRARIAAGEIINNPMLSVSYVRVAKPVLFSVFLTSVPAPVDFALHTHGYILPASVGAVSLDWDFWNEYVLGAYESERDVALSKAWANVDISAIQALASLGELPETMHWMASLMKRMISIMRAFSQKRLLITAGNLVRSGKNVIDAMSELWLEFRYAVRPLIFDMKQAMEAWNHVLSKSDRFTARGFNRLGPEVTSSTFDELEIWRNVYAIKSRTQTVSADFRAGVLFTVDADVNELRSVWGLDRPFETIWELIPFSFMIDWFFSVGHVISSWTLNPGLNPLTSFLTETITVETKDTMSGVYLGQPVYDNSTFTDLSLLSSGSDVTKVITKRRIPSPVRSILPTFQLNLDTAKLIDLASIGRNIFSTLNRRS
jgi:hypothetical protein